MNFLEFVYGKNYKKLVIGFIVLSILIIGIALKAQPKGLPYDKGLYGFTLSDGFYSKRGNGIHGSWDIALPSNTPLFANMAGHVTAKYNWRAGLFIEIRDGDYEVILCHLNEQRVLTGWDVKYGDPLGFTGDSGEATGPHLHYQVKYKGVPIMPQQFM